MGTDKEEVRPVVKRWAERDQQHQGTEQKPPDLRLADRSIVGARAAAVERTHPQQVGAGYTKDEERDLRIENPVGIERTSWFGTTDMEDRQGCNGEHERVLTGMLTAFDAYSIGLVAWRPGQRIWRRNKCCHSDEGGIFRFAATIGDISTNR